jgi:hypothetical protein
MRSFRSLILVFVLLSPICFGAMLFPSKPSAEESQSLSLITATPEEGFQVAIELARKGVTETQPDKDILFMLREVYSRDPDALIAASHVVAVHFQTVAAANNYWREEGRGD